jgi:hypothetical protein
MGKKIRVWDGTAWQDVAPSLPYTAIHSAQASMPLTGVDGQVWLDTDGTLAGQDFVPLSGGTMTGNLNTPSINNGNLSGDNIIINGNFEFWQRRLGVESTPVAVATGQYAADRWAPQQYQAGRHSRVNVTAGSGPISRYAMKVGSQIGGARLALAQRVESSIAQNYRGRQMTVSFWIKFSHANFVSTTATIYGNFYAGIGYNTTTTDAAHGTTGWDSFFQPAVIANGSLPTSWTKYTSTFTVPSNTNNIVFLTQFSDLGTATDDSYSYEITDVKIEPGTSATPFSMHGKSYAGELAACQRYYYRTNGTTYTPLTVGGYTQSSTDLAWWVPLPVSMRVPPTSLDFSGSGAIAFRSANNGSGYTMGNLTFSSSLSTLNLARGGGSISSGTWVAFHSGYLEGNNGPCFLGFSAEL